MTQSSLSTSLPPCITGALKCSTSETALCVQGQLPACRPVSSRNEVQAGAHVQHGVGQGLGRAGNGAAARHTGQPRCYSSIDEPLAVGIRQPRACPLAGITGDCL